jgi:TRAP-type transport system periplasmic protein
MKLTPICTALVAACSFALTTASYGQEIRAHTLRFAHQNSKEHPQGQGVLKFIELVKNKSGGKIDVRDFPGGTLGGDIANISSLQGGTLDLIVLNAGLLVGVSKEFAIVDMPFTFNDPKEADAIVDGTIGKKLFDLLPPKGLVGLAYWELGFRNVTNSKRPIAKLEDFSGLKLRVLQSPLFIDTFTALGANPVPMPFPEVYSALEQKVVDGQENPVTVIVDSKFQEVQKFLSLTKHIYNPQSVIMSKKSWDKLNAAEQKIIQEAATEATAYQRQVSRKANDDGLATLKKTGMQVNDIAPAEMTKIRDKIKPVSDKYAAQVGEALVKEMNAELAKLRGK